MAQKKTLIIAPTDLSLTPVGDASPVADARVSVVYSHDVWVNHQPVARVPALRQSIPADGLRVEVLPSDDDSVTEGKGFAINVLLEFTAKQAFADHSPTTPKIRRTIMVSTADPDEIHLGSKPHVVPVPDPAQYADVVTAIAAAAETKAAAAQVREQAAAMYDDVAAARDSASAAQGAAARAAQAALDLVAPTDTALAKIVQSPKTKAALDEAYEAKGAVQDLVSGLNSQINDSLTASGQALEAAAAAMHAAQNAVDNTSDAGIAQAIQTGQAKTTLDGAYDAKGTAAGLVEPVATVASDAAKAAGQALAGAKAASTAAADAAQTVSDDNLAEVVKQSKTRAVLEAAFEIKGSISTFLAPVSARIDGIADLLVAIVPSGGVRALGKGEIWVNVRDHGAVGDGVTDDTDAFKAAIAEAIRTRRELWVPHSEGPYVCEAPLLVQNCKDFGLRMDGRVKRKDNSVRNSLWFFKNVKNSTIASIRTDGNVSNNGYPQSDGKTYLVDESKHDIRVDGCARLRFGVIDSVNPAGDTIYVTGASKKITVTDPILSWADVPSGRNSVSLIDVDGFTMGVLDCENVGCPDGVIAMPGGFDIEPNAGQSVKNVITGDMSIRTAGTCGLNSFGQYGSAQIQNVKIGTVYLTKIAGVKATACDMVIRGTQNLEIKKVWHSTDTANTNQVLTVDDSSNITMNVEVPRTGKPVNLGPTRAVSNLNLSGAIRSSLSHCIQIYALDGALIDMTLKNPANGNSIIAKNSNGTSSKVTFKGDWAKDQTGSLAMNVGGTVTDWEWADCDLTGWGQDTRIRGAGTPQNVRKRNVRGLTTGTAKPNFDVFAYGDVIENTTNPPVELGATGSKFIVEGWKCIAGGAPGTWAEQKLPTGN